MKQIISFLSGIIVAVLMGFAMFWIIHDPTIDSHAIVKDVQSESKPSNSTTETTSIDQAQSYQESSQTPEIASSEPEGVQDRALQPDEWERRAMETAETYNSNTHTDAEIIVLTTSSLCVEQGLNDQNEILAVQDWLTDKGWNRSYWDEPEPEEQGKAVPLLTAKYYWRQTGRHGDQSQDDRLGRTQLALSRDGYTQEQIDDILSQMEAEGLE